MSRVARAHTVAGAGLRFVLAFGAALIVGSAAWPAETPSMSPQQIIERLEVTVRGGTPDDESVEQRESLISALEACGNAAVPVIATRLAEADETIAFELMRALVGIGTDSAVAVLLEQIAHSPSANIADRAIGVLENKRITRPLSPDELAALTTRVLTESVGGAGLVARVLGNCQAVPVEGKLPPIMNRFEREVLSTEPLPPVLGSYVSPRVFMLNQFLLALKNTGAPAIPMLRQKRAQVSANSELDKWFLLGLGMAGDESVAEGLKTLVLTEPDIYVRCVSVSAYALSAKQAAIPVLESLLDDPTVSEYRDCTNRPIRLIALSAQSALAKLKRQEHKAAE